MSLTEQQRDGACPDCNIIPQVRGDIHAAHDTPQRRLGHQPPQRGTSEPDTSQIA
ncbi:hypothetical protein GCM10028772_06130 [Nocardioides ultimimeridianus]